MSNSPKPIEFDPQGREVAALFSLAGTLEGKSVLEIGSGDGRLTWRYAHSAARVVGIDPSGEKVAKAIQDTSVSLRDRVEFHTSGVLEYVLAYPAERFDLAILSWSL